ncbi:MAG: hypothetical protein AAGA83_24300 [Cyanobacteria bacterium P01_F01_bin.116]
MYESEGQLGQDYDLYAAALDTLSSIAPRMSNWPLTPTEARYLRSHPNHTFRARA